MNTTLNSRSFQLTDVPAFKKKMLNWLKPFGIFCYLDNGGYDFTPQREECLVAVGAKDFVTGNDLKKADAFIEKKQWVFGHLSYEASHASHGISSRKKDKIGFAPFYFFTPQIFLNIKGDCLLVNADEPEKIFAAINAQPLLTEEQPGSVVQPQPVLSKEEYIAKIQSLQAHILRGDCYEINFCQEFFAEGATINPFVVFQKLMQVSPAPFSAFYRLHDKYLLCASPERFLTKSDGRLISQPMKGTIKRALPSIAEDEGLKSVLRNSAKDRAENVMIVDLVRNDLTRICKEGSVRVDELFGVYTFPQVHQMVSTVSGALKENASFSQIMQATFPMGSMTGAPKYRVMQLIDDFEPSARGIFSGTVGYVNPDGDFDFNVVIRSLMYNKAERLLTYQAGSGITFYSDAEQEWEECMLKAEGMRKALL